MFNDDPGEIPGQLPLPFPVRRPAMADPRRSTKDIAEIAVSLRQIHDEVVAIGTEDHERLDRLEADMRYMRQVVDALCMAIGGPAREALKRLKAEEDKARGGRLGKADQANPFTRKGC